jgi:hypothetical protein
MAVQRYAPTVIKVIDVLLFFFLEKKLSQYRLALSLINWKTLVKIE